MEDPLDAYVTQLLSEKGEPDTLESHQVLLDEVNEAVDQALIGALPLKQLDELEAATQEGRVDDALLEKLLGEVGVDADQVMQEALENFRNKYLKGEK